MNERQIAQGLGWFSIGLGLSELLAPRKVNDLIGVQNRHDALLQSLGVREIASGIGLLTAQDARPWLWSRVAGDAMDISLLVAAMTSDRNDRRRLAGALGAVLGVTALDVMASVRSSKQARDGRAWSPGATHAPNQKTTVQTITVNRSPQEVYEFWRKFENLARFMPHLKSVEELSEGRTRWVAKGPAGTVITWEAVTTEDRPGEMLAWRSVPGSQLENEGSVEFEEATGSRGTIIRVNFSYSVPGGAAVASVAKLLGGSPEQRIPLDLLRFKQLIETGEITRTKGQPAGRQHSLSPKFDSWRSQ